MAKKTTHKEALRIALKTDYDKRAKKIRTSTLERDINAMQKEANRRYKALNKRGMNGAATQRFERELKSEWNATGKTQNQLLNRAKKLQYFLGLKTSTVKGYRAAVKQGEEFIGKVERIGLSEAEQHAFWDAWDKMKENRDLKVWSVGSDVVMGQIAEIIKSDKRVRQGKTIVSRLTKSYAQAVAEKNTSLWKKQALVNLD